MEESQCDLLATSFVGIRKGCGGMVLYANSRIHAAETIVDRN
jgi:hypothetical protein